MPSNVCRVQTGLLPRWRWFVDYSGPGNRIWIAWNDDFIDVDILNIGTQFVHCRVHMHEIHEHILITVVYGANEVSARRELWQGLTELAVAADLPWLVGGDFNAVLDMSEVSGASGDIRVAMHDFNDCIIQTGLISLPMQGERFSWHNCSTDGRSLWKRLDRMFVNDAWLEQWPNLFYTCLTPRTSDHSPLVLKGDSRDVQVSMFRFDNYLALSPGFLASVHNIWQHPVIAGFLEVAQILLQADRHNSLLLQLENCCRLVYLKATQLEHVMLRQRAKLQWLKGGDQCSKAFFRRVATRRANKRLFQISDSDGLVQTNPTTISSVFVTYFQDLLGGDRTDRALDLHYLRPWARHILTEEEACALIRPVTVDDVKTAMFDIEEDKAPGPDGRLLKQVNATLLTLIPKILVCRIREILDLLISPSQNAFIPGRLISDNVLLAQELFSGYNQCRLPPRCALKVDLRKAYDTVEWDFLFATLRLFGFPAVFIRWIEECITSAHYSVVVNGGVHGFFAGARGLRQGDPMSPYLFVLVMEVLQMILQQFIDQDGQFLYHWRCSELKLFQLSFADDLLLLCKADVRSVSLFRRGLDVFASLSGLHTNPQKSQLIFSKAASGLRDSLLETLGFQEGHLPVRYLGLPLISARLSIADCQPLLQKIDSRIKGWEGVQLSFAGRVQLIKSVLVSLEVYWAMAFILPKGIINEMKTIAYLSLERFDFGIVQYGQLRKTKEHGVGGKCSHLDIRCCLISNFGWGMDRQWNWPMITDIACLEITYMLPPISEGQDRISWKSNNGSFNTSTAYDLFRPPGPKERNSRRFQQSSRTPSIVGNLVVEELSRGSLVFSYGSGASAIPEDSSCNLNGDFDFDEFYELATRVLNGDSESLTSLQALKLRWELKFKTRRNPLKPVIGRPSTPFRPRISLLPRRFVRTDLETLPAPNVETSHILDGDSRSSELEIHGRSSSQSGPDSQEQVLQEAQLGDLMDSAVMVMGVRLARPRVHLPKVKHPKKQRLPQIVILRGFGDLAKDGRDNGTPGQNPASSPTLVAAPTPTVHEEHPEHPAIYVGTVKLQTSKVDNIAGAFLQSSRKTLHFVPPTKQNGEIIIRPTKEVVDNGSKKWQTTAVGYCLGRRPYFPQLEAFARANWKGLQQVSATSSGFFFFRFTTRFAMEDVIEGGPWLFQGQPIVLQFWEQGMSLRRQKHTQIPVWIRLRHLPMEYWTEEGLSTVASGIGTPLYTDGITKNCSRLDYARVCVMLDFSSALPKHLVVISPTLRNGKEDPKRVEVEYEWLPQRCSHCCSLGHVATSCPENTKKIPIHR
ncbi:UNVERIFIED_CONTAM: Retrovirus-related Pol polyprotein from type-2 retrotransposable element R2DM [Sesamum calycinum]|uniref:Retrovirus-related Pol polyprotein from type-2 retrotransposable element R2DM n=1 Tax=Sesamum calycinum TaxID=2727403 RepID=A0AAW2K672_9LAMI